MSRVSKKTTQTLDQEQVNVKTRAKTPSMYKVVILNDDFTPMDFVVSVLISLFNKGEVEAKELMLKIHRQGSVVAGVYTFEIAETKAAMLMELSKRSQHPLRCRVEKE